MEPIIANIVIDWYVFILQYYYGIVTHIQNGIIPHGTIPKRIILEKNRDFVAQKLDQIFIHFGSQFFPKISKKE